MPDPISNEELAERLATALALIYSKDKRLGLISQARWNANATIPDLCFLADQALTISPADALAEQAADAAAGG